MKIDTVAKSLVPKKDSGKFKKLRIVIGATFRSRAGCKLCKIKKKKCDEQKPTCGLCARTSRSCHWPNKDTDGKDRASGSDLGLVEGPTQKLQWDFGTSDVFDSFGTYDNAFVNNISLADIDAYTSYQLSVAVPLYTIPDDICCDKGREYLEYFTHSIASTISVVPSEKNYFLSFYLPLAFKNQALLYALIGWGERFKSQDNEYFNRSVSLMYDNINALQKHTTDKESLIGILACATVLQGVEISMGDVSGKWLQFLKVCQTIIRKLGGIEALIHSKEEKFLVSNFVYHDLLASSSLENGTAFPIESYDRFYFEGVNYIDSLQSCVGPLFVIMGDILNTSKKFREQLFVLRNSRLEFQPGLTDDERINLLLELESKYKKLEFQIIDLKPKQSELDYFLSIYQLEFHVKLFQLYQYIVMILLKQSLKQLPTSMPEIQLLVLQSNKLIDELIISPVKSLLCLAFVLVGFNSVTDSDRQAFLDRAELLMAGYKIANLQRAFELIKESWKNNGDDDIYLKWLGSLKKFNWNLSLV